MTDVLSNTINTIRVAVKNGKSVCVLKPVSKLVIGVLEIMKKNGYIDNYEIISDSRGGFVRIVLNKSMNDCKAIRPQISVHLKDLQKYEKRFLPALNFGILVFSTSQGLMTNVEAREKHVGGKLLLYVY